jgi:hypothetical protein
MEEYLGLLRAKRALIQVRVSEADEQLGMVRDALDSVGIAEISQSDDDSSVSSPPHSSEFLRVESDSASESSATSLNISNGPCKNHTNDTAPNGISSMSPHINGLDGV